MSSIKTQSEVKERQARWMMTDQKIRVTVWNEYWDERLFDHVAAIYPSGIQETIGGFLRTDQEFQVKTAFLQEAECGLPDQLLEQTDVLVWWGHVVHDKLPEDRVRKICERVLDGMGFVALHSGMYSKPFERLVGTCMNSAFRELGERERVWVVNPAHEICRGLGACFELEHSEVYREPTGYPLPEEILFLSWYAGGEAGISGGCYYRGRGRIFYFTPGHEDYPIYQNEQVQQVIVNGVRWAHNPWKADYESGEVAPLEPLDEKCLLHYEKQR